MSTKDYLKKQLQELTNFFAQADDVGVHEELRLESLEPRVMYDASPVGAAMDSGDAQELNSLDTDSLDELDRVSFSTSEDSLAQAIEEVNQLDGESEFHVPPPGGEIVFIDERIDDLEQLVNDLVGQDEGGQQKDYQVVILDSEQDGISQISNYLSGYHNFDAVHIVSHGTEGQLQLGGMTLTSENIEQYESQIHGWASGLTQTADIMLYGCDVAGSESGEWLVQEIASLTSADVAASDDLTGHQSLGGDWEFEYHVGVIQTEIFVSQSVLDDWYATLEIVNLNPTQDTWLDADNNSDNYGAATSLVVDRSGGDYGDGRAILQFDIGAIPVNATINSATLTLNATSNGSAFNINVYEVLEAWEEGVESGGGSSDAASWRNRTDTQSWSTDGGVIDPTVIDTVYTASTGLHNWDVTTLVQSWYTGSSTNNGLMLASPDTGTTSVVYDSREGSIAPTLTIDYTVPNSAPVLSGANDLSSIDEDIVSNSGTLISSLLSGHVSDANGGDPEGIAVIGVDNSNGTWEYTTNGGSTWQSFGSVDNTSARLLASDGDSFVRFVPDASWNGTVSEGITFHAWDQSSGTSGGIADMTTTGALITSSFDSYSDGSGWTGNWTEIGESNGSSFGDVSIGNTGEVVSGDSSYLRMELTSGTGIERAVDLSGTESATVSFYYEQNDAGVGGDFSIEAWDGTSWQTLQTYSITSDNYFGASGVYSGELTIPNSSSVTKIRFYTTSASSFGTDIVYIDDVQITPTVPDTGGESAFSTNSFSAGITVNAVNDAPTISNLGDSIGIVEGGSGIVLDLDVSVEDIELDALNSGNGNYSGTSLTVVRNGGANADDVLSFNDGNGITLSGGNLIKNSQVIATFDTTTSPGELVITFTDSNGEIPTSADVDNVMRQITYSNSSDTPPANVQIDWTFDDGNAGSQGSGGAMQSTGSTTVNIQNAADLLITAPATGNADEDTTFVFSGANVVQIDDGIIADTRIQVSLNVANGTLTLAGTTGIAVVEGADGSSSLVIEGLESDINAALDGLQFDATSDYYGGDTLSISTSLAADLEGHYTFDGGSASDQSSGTAQDGTFVGNATTTIDGTRGEVLSLDGTGDYVEIPGMFSEPADVTLSTWFNATESGTVLVLGNNIGINVGDNGNDLFGFFYDGTSYHNIVSNMGSLIGDGWHHVALSFDDVNNTQSLYLDGVLVAQTNHTTSINYAYGTSTTIGGNAVNTPTYDFGGSIDDARIYDRALSADEIAALATDNSSTSQSVAITVDSVNDAPLIGSLDGNPTYVEDGAAVVLDTDVSISDVELDDLNGGNGNYAGASVSLVRSGGANSDDVLSFNDGNGITLSGGNLIKNSQVIATFDTTSTDGELLITFRDASGEIPTSADVNNILQQITYANSSEAPPASVQIDWTFDDGNTGSQGSGGALTDAGSTTVNINRVNDDPFNSGSLPTDISVTEDVSSNVDLSAVDFGDVDAASSSLTVTLTTSTGGNLSAAAGTGITLGGTSGALTITGNLADLNSYFNNSANITYLHGTPNTYGDNADSIQVEINDNGNTGSGGGSNILLGTVNVDIDAVNDDPFNSGSLPTDISVTEDVSSNVDLSAVDFGDVDAVSGSLTVTLTTSTGLNLTGAAGTGITLGGGSPGVLTISGTLADLNVYFDNPANITYLHGTPHTFGDNVDTIQVEINDNGNTGSGGGSNILLGTVNVDITGVNDEQILATNTGTTVAEGSSGTTITPLMLETIDFDNTNSQLLYTVNAVPVNGTLRLSGAALSNGQTFTQADIASGDLTYDHDGSQTSADSFDFTVDDGAGTTTTSTFSFTVTNVNDATVISGIEGTALDYTENDGAVAITSTIQFTDVDDTNIESAVIQISSGYNSGEDVLSFTDQNGIVGVYDSGTGTWTLSGSATLAQYETAVRSITYTNTSENPDVTTRIVSITVNDGDVDSNTVVRNISVASVNDAPIVFVTANSPAFVEDGTAQTLFSGAAIDPVESGDQIDSMVFNVSGIADGSDEILVIDGLEVQLTDLNSVTTLGNSYDVDVSVVGSTATVTISKAGGFSSANAETLLNSIAYSNSSENPSTNNRQVEFVSIADNGGGTDTTSDGTISTVSVTSNNEGPAFSSLDNIPSFTEGGSEQILDADVTIFDEELSLIDDFGGATISIYRSSGPVAEDLFSATGNLVFSAGNVELSSVVVGTYSQSGGSLVISFGVGTSNAEVNEVLQSIAYENLSENPPPSVSLDWVFDDGNAGSQGSGGAISSTATQSVNIQGVNDAPINTSPANAVVTEETATAIGGISVSDVDDSGANLSTQLQVTDGVLSVSLSGSASISAGANGSADLTLTGSVADINATLASLTYTGNVDVSGVAADSLTITTDDLGNSGSGGALQDVDIVQIDITPTEDVPITNDGTISITEDTSHAFQSSDFAYFDSDGDPLDHIQITRLPVGGTLTLSGSNVTLGDLIDVSDIDAGNLVYSPAQDGYGVGYDDFGFRVSDGNGYSPETSTVTVLNADFESGLNGFTYVDDYFGTSLPGNANGLWDAGGGQGGSDGLRIDLGDNAGSLPTSGAFTQTINLVQDSIIQLTLDFRLDVANQLDIGEYGEAIFEIDGVRYGSGLNTSLAHIEGGGDSGWQTYTIELALSAGDHDLTLGGYVNRTNANNEDVSVYFDNVFMEQLIHNDMTVDVSPTSDAPVLDNTGSMTLTPVLEDTTASDPVGDTVAAIIASAGGDRITDPDGDPEGIAVTAVDNTNGTWYFSTNGGSSWTAFDAVGVSTGAADDSAAVVLDLTAMIKFVPVGDFNGIAGDITFRAWDTTDGSTSGDSGIDVSTNGGGTAFSTETETASITVTPQNDDSDLTLSGSVNYIENSSPVLLASAATVTDIDLVDFDTGTLTVDLTSGGTIFDRLSIQAVGNGVGEVNVSGTDVLYEGVVVGSFTGEVDGLNPLVITFNANADEAAVQAVTQSVSFENISNDPTTARTFDMTLTDGDGGSVTVGESIAITAVNDAPSISNLGGDSVIVPNDATVVLLDANLAAVISDPDNPVDLVGGSLQVNGIGFDAWDLLRLDVSGSLTLSAGFADGSIVSISGIDIGTLSGVTDSSASIAFNSNATVSRVETLIQSFTFESTSSTYGARSVDFTLIDGDGVANGGDDTSISTVNVFVSNGANGLVTTNEDIIHTFTATDFDFTGFTGNTLNSITVTGLPADGTLLLNGSAININETITKAEIDAGLFEFEPDSDGNGLLYASFDFYINNGVSTVNVLAGEANSYTLNGGSLWATDQILADGSHFGAGGTVASSISVVNSTTNIDAAYLSQGDVFFNGYVPDANWTAGELSDLDTWVQSGGVLISTGDSTSYDAVNDYYGLTTVNGGNSTWNVADDSSEIMNGPFGLVGNNGDPFSAAGTISYFDSASLAVGDQIIATDSTSGEPTMVLRSHGSGFILFTSDEGIFRGGMTGGGTISTANDILAANIFAWATSHVPANESHTVDVSVTAVNDDPFDNGSMPTDVVVTEDVSSDLDLSGVEIMDVDEASGNMTVTLSAGIGTLASADNGGVTVTVIDPQTIQLDGTMSDLNSFLDDPANIQYTSFLNSEGNDADTISFTVSDNGNTGAGGGTPVNFGTINVDITPVNDEEVITNNTTAVIDENDSIVLTNAYLQTTDIENGPATLVYTIDSTVASGSILLDGSTVLADTDTFTQQDIDSGRISYQNDGSETTSDSFAFTVDDGSGTGSSGVFNFDINPVNDAPVLDDSGSPTLTSILEDESNPSGDSIADVLGSVGDPISDDELGAVEGIAVTDVDDANGTWQYSLNGGFSWIDFGPVSESSAVLLTDAAQIRFVPDPDFNGTPAGITYRAWDQTFGSEGDVGVDTTLNGGTTAFSVIQDTATLDVISVNDAPILDNSGDPMMTTITEDDLNNNGDSVADILLTGAGANPISDIDAVSMEGIAIDGYLTTNSGTWQYSTDGGASWSDVGVVDETSALLLAENDRLRFVPNSVGGETAVLSFKAWDQTTGIAGNKVDVSLNGGTTAFSADLETITILVTDVNDAPVLDNSGNTTLTYINEDETNSPGQTVTDILFSDALDQITDVDSGANEGIAVIGVDDSNGVWEYSLDGGSSWNSFAGNGVSTTGPDSMSAVLLDVSAVIRFAPNPDYNGDPGDLVYRAWDQSDLNVSGATGIDASTTGGATAFSSATETLDTYVTAVNDAPVISINNVATVLEGGQVTIDGTLLIGFDVDDSASELSITITSAPVHGQLELLSNPGVSVSAFTQLDIDTGQLIYVHDAGESTMDQFDFRVSDGGEDGAVSANGTFHINVTAVNDAPDLLNNDLTVYEGGTAMISLAELSATDVDNLDESLTLVVQNVSGGQFELASDPGVPITSFTVNQVQSGEVLFVDDGDEFAPSYDVFVTDGMDVSATQSANISFVNVNDEEVIVANTDVQLNEGATRIIDSSFLSVADEDNTPDQIVYTVTTPPANGQLELTTSPGVSVGSFTQDDIDNNRLAFVHDGGESVGSSFDFDVDDGQGTSTSGTFTMTIDAVNDAPTVIATSNPDVFEGGMVVIECANLHVFDPDDNSADITISLTTTPANGHIARIGDPDNPIGSFTKQEIDSGQIVYVHNGTETTTDHLMFSISDVAGASTSGHQLNINIIAVNDAPIATTDEYFVDEDNLLNVVTNSISNNDSDAEGDTLTATLVSGPSQAASFVLNPNGTFSYQPELDFYGTDTFTYQVADGNGGTDEATVTIHVLPVNDMPEGRSDEYTVAQGNVLSEIIGVLANDSDVEDDPLTATLVSGPTNGILIFDNSGTFTYIPYGGFIGEDHFVYVANDGQGNSIPITVTINVAASYESDGDGGAGVSDPDAGEETSDELTDTESDSEVEDAIVAVDPNFINSDRTNSVVDAETEFSEIQFDFNQSKRTLLENISNRQNAEAIMDYLVDNGQRMDELDEQLQNVSREFTSYFDARKLAEQLAVKQKDKLAEILGLDISIGTVTVAGTAGFILWSLRGGLLLATAISHLPTWKMVDPLPILDSYPTKNSEEKEFGGMFN